MCLLEAKRYGACVCCSRSGIFGAIQFVGCNEWPLYRKQCIWERCMCDALINCIFAAVESQTIIITELENKSLKCDAFARLLSAQRREKEHNWIFVIHMCQESASNFVINIRKTSHTNWARMQSNGVACIRSNYCTQCIKCMCMRVCVYVRPCVCVWVCRRFSCDIKWIL